MSEELEKLYPKTVEALKGLLGERNYNKLRPYLHAYEGTKMSVKPVAKAITIYYIARAADTLTIRTEGESDIVLSRMKGGLTPTILFRKLKAVYLRSFMNLARDMWIQHNSTLKSVWYGDVDFLSGCSLAVGIAGDSAGVEKGRCMKCPVDVLMGAVTGKETYNLASRFVGDSAYATEPRYTVRTGNAVDEVTHTTIMLKSAPMSKGASEEERRTGGLYQLALVEPGTLFVGKHVLYMASPSELLYVLYLLNREIRVGARTSIQGTLEVCPVVIIGDLYEVGASYSAAEAAFNKNKLDEVKGAVLSYLQGKNFKTGSGAIEFTSDMIDYLRDNVNVLDAELVKELWMSAKNYVEGVRKYISGTSS